MTKENAVQDSSTTGSISAAEQRRRQAAVDFARASVGLEGFKPSAETEELLRRHVLGEISMDEVMQPIPASARDS